MGAATANSKTDDAAQKVAELARSNVQVGASPVIKQASAAIAGVFYGSEGTAQTVTTGETPAAQATVAGTSATGTGEDHFYVGTSFTRMIWAKKSYVDRAEADIAIFENSIATSSQWLAKGATQEQIDAGNDIKRDNIERIRTGSANIEQIASKWLADVSSLYDVTGTVFTKDDAGKLQWGIFEVRNKQTGEFYFGHDGSGVGKEYDPVNRSYIETKL